MKYYSIENSLNEKLMGKIPQIKEFIYHCNVDTDPNSIDKFIFEKIEIQPILSNVVLYTNAKQTDFIDTYGHVGFGFGYLISDKFKQILENFNCYGFQFFKTYIVQNNQKVETYWQTNVYDFPYHCIDFKKTSFLLKDRDINRNVISEVINFNDFNEFKSFLNNIRYPKMLFFKDIIFNENMNLDLFTLRYTEDAHKGIVSETLKNELEKNEITGIEYRPIEISFQGWVKRDGPRDQIYGRSW
jgi:hypothetical protein